MRMNLGESTYLDQDVLGVLNAHGANFEHTEATLHGEKTQEGKC